MRGWLSMHVVCSSIVAHTHFSFDTLYDIFYDTHYDTHYNTRYDTPFIHHQIQPERLLSPTDESLNFVRNVGQGAAAAGLVATAVFAGVWHVFNVDVCRV